MEVIKFQQCDKCQGSGQVADRKCEACFGFKSFYFSNNNFLFWKDQINYTQIFIRAFKQTINIVVNTFLIFASIFTLILIYIILNKVQFDPRNLWIFITSVHPYNFWLFIMIILDMYLYYRLTVPNIKFQNKISLLKSKNAFVKHNIADNLSQEARRIIDQAWLYAKAKKVWPVTAWHVLYILFNDKDIRLVLARLGLGVTNLKNKIDQNLAQLAKQADPGKDLAPTVKEALLNSYFHMNDRQAQTIAEIDLLFGLAASSQGVKNFFYDFDIDEQKIDNVIAWIKINNLLKQRYQRFRSKSFFKPKSDVNRAYTAMATPTLDAFSQDFTKMAKAGYAVIAIDWRGFGERDDHQKPNWNDNIGGRDICNIHYIRANILGMTLLGMNIHDGSCALDYLCNQDFVDDDRIGVMGLSFGGTMATWISICDDRIKATDIICYSDRFADFGMRDTNFCGSQITPGLYELCDVPDLQGLIAPRPLLVEIGVYDDCFLVESAMSCFREVEKIYIAADSSDKLELDLFEGGHQWSGRKTLRFFGKHLASQA